MLSLLLLFTFFVGIVVVFVYYFTWFLQKVRQWASSNRHEVMHAFANHVNFIYSLQRKVSDSVSIQQKIAFIKKVSFAFLLPQESTYVFLSSNESEMRNFDVHILAFG